MTTCTNTGNDQTDCPANPATSNFVEVESILSIQRGSCGEVSRSVRSNIHTNVHHRKLNNTIQTTVSATCGSSATITLKLRRISGDPDGVEVAENDGGYPPQFSILLWIDG